MPAPLDGPTLDFAAMPGPLSGLRVVELAGIGPGPHACMLLADLGAEVLRIDRPGGGVLRLAGPDVLARGRHTVVVDLKDPAAGGGVLRLVAAADVLVEGNRPGSRSGSVSGRRCAWSTTRLVYARMTGWGQDGPWASHVGTTSTTPAWSGRWRRSASPAESRSPPQPRRGLRRRVAVLRRRHPGRAGRAVRQRPRAGGRRGDGRRGLVADGDVLTRCAPAGRGRTGGGATCSTAGRRSTTPTSAADGRYVAVWGRWSRSSSPS